MCIILGEVNRVSKTKLFVLPNEANTRQMTFYTNIVGTPETNLMILPVPHADTVELHRIDSKDLFHALKASVQSTYRSPRHGMSRSFALSASLTPRETLEIVDHGSYRVSIAPGLEDLLRLDLHVFDLQPEMIDFFARHYTSEFGYICCVLKAGEKEYEPLCYSHALHSSGKLFVPTLHYHNHGGRVHTEDADWDHLIYSVGTTERANLGFTSNYNNEVNWKKFPKEFQKLQVSSVRCAKLTGHHKNQDITFELY
jgi:hypothetical protein